jgi:hypothetical protein
MRTLVFGSQGYLGENFVKSCEGIASPADIADSSQVAIGSHGA